MLYACIALILFAGVIFCQGNKIGGKSAFVIFAFAVLFLYSALRDPSLSGDLKSYVSRFDGYSSYSFNQIISLYDSGIKSPTYHVLGWIFSRVFPYSQAWVAFLAAIYLIVVSVIIFTESEKPVLSYIMILSLGFFAFSLTGMRQTVAMAITTLAFYAIRDRKPIRFVLLVLFASLFHASAIIFIIIYPLARRKLGLLHLAIVGGMFSLFFFGQSLVREWIAIAFEDSYLSGYAKHEATLTVSGFVIQAVMFVFALSYYRRVIAKNANAIILFNLCFIGLMFQLFSSMVAEAFRVSMYFSFFNILLIPLCINAEKDYQIKAYETVFIPIIFILYLVTKGLPEYQFFWL